MRALSFALCLAVAAPAAAADFKAQAAQKSLIEGFNSRDWEAVKGVLAEDAVFHRANAKEVFVGREAVVGEPIADQWNVKFAALKATDQFTGKDGRVVERGDFAITAGQRRGLLSRVLHDDVGSPS